MKILPVEKQMSKVDDSIRNLLLVATLAEPSRPPKLSNYLETAGFRSLLPDGLEKNERARAVEAAASALEGDGLLRRLSNGALELTPDGKQTALAFLGARKNYPKLGWERAPPQGLSIRKSSLPAKALGIEGQLDHSALRRLANAENLRAEILRQRFDLDLSFAPSKGAARAALGWKLLERGATSKVIVQARQPKRFGPETRILAALLCSATEKELQTKKIEEIVAAEALNISDPDSPALYDALGRLALEGKLAFPTATFAEEAQRAATKIRDGRVGDSLVFVSHAWKQFVADGNAITLDQFKNKLVDAHRSHNLTLAKADMPQTLNRADVTASETKDRNVVFTFIRVSA